MRIKSLNNSTIWVTWEHHPRNTSICKLSDIPLFTYESKLPAVLRYIFSTLWLVKILFSARPHCLIVQNPSIILVTVALILKFFFKYKLIMDAHNAGIYPAEGRIIPLNKYSFFLQRSTDLTIVTNKLLAQKVTENRGNPFILPDPLPDPPDVLPIKMNGEYIVFVICSFRQDEPYQEILQATSLLPDTYHFYFSGKYKRGNIIPEKFPNVSFLGFVEENVYWSALKTCSIVMDLTKRNDCLVCGAYESVSVLKPIILSDTIVNRELFKTGCVYTKLFPSDIADSVKLSYENHSKLSSEIVELNNSLKIHWTSYKNELLEIINKRFLH